MTQIILFDYAREVNAWLAEEGLGYTIKDVKMIDNGRCSMFMVIYEKPIDK